MWIAVFSYIGNYFWTHYFFKLLGAAYTMPAWKLNEASSACSNTASLPPTLTPHVPCAAREGTLSEDASAARAALGCMLLHAAACGSMEGRQHGCAYGS